MKPITYKELKFKVWDSYGLPLTKGHGNCKKIRKIIKGIEEKYK